MNDQIEQRYINYSEMYFIASLCAHTIHRRIIVINPGIKSLICPSPSMFQKTINLCDIVLIYNISLYYL